MKRILQRKFMLVFWLAMFVNSLSLIAQTYEIKGGDGWTDPDPVGEVTVSYNPNNNVTTYNIKWIRGFGIENFSTASGFLGRLTPMDKDENYSYYIYEIYGESGNTDREYTADFFIEPITESVELCNIFNYYSPKSSVLSNNEVVVSSDVKGSEGSSAHPLVVDFQNTDPIIIHMKEGKKISGFDMEVNNGNVTFAVEGIGEFMGSTTNYTNYQNDITLNTGRLTLQGQVVGIGNLEIRGGTLTIDGKDGERANVENLNASGGTINMKNIHTKGVISNLKLSGDVTITGGNQFTNETGVYDCNDIEGFLYNKATVTKGKVLLKTVPINPRSLFEVQGGDVTFEKVTFGSVNFWNGNISGTADIQIKGGTVIFDNCHFEKRDVNANTDLDYVVEVEAGSLTIKDGVYKAGIKAFLHTTGTGNVSIENGLFDAAYDYSTTTDQRNYLMELNGGKVTIVNGIFRGTCSCVESGALEVNGGSYRYSSTYYSNIKDASFYIKDNAADIKIQGGEFSTASIYFESGVTKSISDLLPTDYHFYKEYNGYFAEEVTDFRRGEEYNLPGKILEFASVSNVLDPTNKLLDDAKTADVGPDGIDVKVVQSRLDPWSRNNQYLYTYEINTPKGLVWYAAVQNIPESIPNANLYPLDAGDFGGDLPSLLKEGKPSVVLTADLNMEGYDWVPFSIRYGMLFDGKGHVISNLTVKQTKHVAFISFNSGMVANLVLRDCSFTLKDGSKGSWDYFEMGILACQNSGVIVNCGVQNSTITCDSDISGYLGGFVAQNFGGTTDSEGVIYNSYVTGNITVSMNSDSSTEHKICNDYSNVSVYAGGFIGVNHEGATIENCYHVGDISCSKPDENPDIVIYSGDFIPENVPTDDNFASIGTLKDYYTNPELQTLNSNVISHSHSVGEMEWSKWITESGVNNGYPIHGYNNESIYMGASVIESEFTLLKEGNGEFKATYTYLEDETEPESIKTGIIYADTTYTVINQEQFKITATPAEGSELVKVVHIQNGKETELPDIQPGVEFAYNIVVADTLKAYFKETEVEPEPDPGIITTDSLLVPGQVDGNDLVVAAESSDSLDLNISGIKVHSLTVSQGSNVVLVLSGTNALGTVINNGTLVVKEVSGQVDAAIENEGKFIDETGTITEVNGSAGMKVTPMNNQTVDEGETVTLTAEVEASGNVSFQWQKFVDNAWVNIKSTPDIQTRTLLRSMQMKKDQLVVSSAEAGLYRCNITCTSGNVSTTLTTFAIVTVNTDTDEPEDPDTPTIDPVKYYNITSTSVCDGIEISFSKGTVREGGSVIVYVEKDEANYTFDNLKLYCKRTNYGAWEELQESIQPGEYKINNIWTHIYVKAEGSEKKNPTGMEEVEGEKVYTKDGSLFVQTPQREQVIIISMTGAVVKNEEQIGLKQYHGLNPGIYIVRIGEQVFKIRI